MVKRPYITVGFTALVLLLPLGGDLDRGDDPAARARWPGGAFTGWST